MAYTNQAKVEYWFGADFIKMVADDDADGSVDDATFDAAEQVARLEIEGKLKGIFTLPFNSLGDSTATPQMIQAIASWLTGYYLISRQGHAGAREKEFFNLAQKNLDALRAGDTDVYEVSRQENAIGTHNYGSTAVRFRETRETTGGDAIDPEPDDGTIDKW